MKKTLIDRQNSSHRRVADSSGRLHAERVFCKVFQAGLGATDKVGSPDRGSPSRSVWDENGCPAVNKAYRAPGALRLGEPRSFDFVTSPGVLGRLASWFARLSLLAVLFIPAFAGADQFCDVCKEKLVAKYYVRTDNYHDKKRNLCEACDKLTSLCVVCHMPVHPNFGLHLPDERQYCPEDAETAVMTEDLAATLFAKAKQEAMDLLSPYPPIPQWSIETHLVTREEFNREYRRKPGIDDPSKLLGLTFSLPDKEGKLKHDIYLLHGIPRDEFLSVCVHEYTHTWLNEHQKKTRQLHKDSLEGVCELVAYKVVSKLGFEQEKKRILDNNYTHGQIASLVEAEKEYGFHRLVRWIMDGVDSWVDTGKLPRLLVLKEAQDPAPLLPNWGPSKPTAVPDTLILRGLSGTGAHRYALINNATLSVGEQTRVRVGPSNQLVRCLSIASNTVTLQVSGEPAPRQLELDVK